MAMDLPSHLADADASIGRIHAGDLAGLAGDELAAGIVGLRRHIARTEAAIARLVTAAEDAGLWRAAGATSPEAWLAALTHQSVSVSRRQVELAEALTQSGELEAALAEGAITVEHASLLGVVADRPEFAGDVADLIEAVSEQSPAGTRRTVERWLTIVDPAGARARHADHAAQEFLHITPDGRGMHDVTGKLTGGSAAAVSAALSHLAGASWSDDTGRTPAKRRADAFVELARAYQRGEITGGRERAQLLVQVPYESLFGEGETPGTVVGTGQPMAADEVRTLLCTADLHRLITDPESHVLDLGRSARVASTAQWIALAARDQHCRFPECDRPAQWCDAHHIDPVATHDGPTDFNKLVLVCDSHHHLVHEVGWGTSGTGDEWIITDPGGRQRTSRPPAMPQEIRQTSRATQSQRRTRAA